MTGSPGATRRTGEHAGMLSNTPTPDRPEDGYTDERDRSAAATTDDVGRIHFRCERQTLRRLPRTRAIVFTIRTYLLPVAEISQEPGAPGRLADAVRVCQQQFSEEYVD